ncbi:hypothetical protein, partial [Legionella sp.]|uniref:hypothetical protein n=1 Tax=Legionella sp. TaxID=459 RepID=UPI000CC57A5F
MKKSVLFNFIKKDQLNLPEDIQLKSDREDRPYCLVQLPLEDIILKSQQDFYSLQEHHISIYEEMSESESVISQYHYTAIFKNGNGEKCKLHVYYDSSDRVTGRPSFAIQRDSEWEKISTPDLEAEFEKLAREKCIPFISFTKEKLAHHLAELEEQYTQQEMAAARLSREPSKLAKYREALLTLEDSLNALIPLCKHDKYKNVLKLIRKIRSTVEEELSTPLAKPAMPSVKAVNTEPSTNSEPDVVSAKSKKKKKKAKGHAGEFNRQVNELNMGYKPLAAMKFEEISPKDIDALLALHEKSSMIFLELDDKKGLSITVLNNLRIIEDKVEKLGSKMLEALLASKRFDEAKRLIPFHLKLHKEKLIEQSLTESNFELLSFLVDYCGVELSQPVTVNDKKYISIIEFAAANGNENGLFLLGVLGSFLEKEFSPKGDVNEWSESFKNVNNMVASLPSEQAAFIQFGKELGKIFVAENPELLPE